MKYNLGRAISVLFILLLATLLSLQIARADTAPQPCGKDRPYSSDHNDPCTITILSSDTSGITYRINQPIVDRPSYDYDIQFVPGDEITIDGFGCVQTAGSGDTWKRYVDPSGDDSGPGNGAGLYFGTVTIQGALLDGNLSNP